MLDFIKRFIIVAIMALCVGLLFIGGRAKADGNENLKNMEWIWPVQGQISDHFNSRNGHHKGLDIVAPIGNSVRSVEEGKVTKSYFSDTYGHVVFIKHPNDFETVYAHLSKRLVSEGQLVHKGQLIGKIGNTGISTGPHLHFEVHLHEWNIEKNNAINPLAVLSVSAQSTQEEDLEEKERHFSLAYTQMNEDEFEKTKEDKGPIIISVKTNETLWYLSREYQVPVSSIIKWNDLKDETVYSGQRIKIYNNNNNKYVVQSGDTLYSISGKFQTSVETIRRINQLKDDRIYPNQLLNIREGKGD